MTQYKSEIMKATYRWVMSSIRDEEVAELDKLISQRYREGWELVTYTFMGGTGGNIGKGLLITFKKE